VEENTNKIYAERSSSALTDPLLAITTAPAEPGSSLFVINLCASIAPIQAAGKTIPGFESCKLYQVARVEDGRTRHRLRLGFFTSEADAEAVLAQVRDNYPTAFVTCLSDDDRRFTRGYLPARDSGTERSRPVAVTTKPEPPVTIAASPAPQKKEAPKAPAPQPAARTAVPAKAASTPVATPAPKAAALAATALSGASAARTTAAAKAPSEVKPVAAPAPVDEIELSWDPPALQGKPQADTRTTAQTVAPAFKTEPVIKARTPETVAPKPAVAAKARAAEPKKPAIELTLEREPVAAPAAPKAARNDAAQPFHVGKGVEIPMTALTLEATSVQPAMAATANTAPQKPQPSAPAPKQSAARPAQPANKTAAPAMPKAPAVPVPAAGGRGPELDSTQTIRALTSAEMDDEEKWFSIQLVVSEQPVNLDAMPHLDIFEAYRVYSIANAGSGKIVYSLRLGFFREEVSAAAVSGYLKTFFPSPSVMRISTAEQLRFKDAPTPKATAEATARNEARVIELNQARDRKTTIPTVTMEVAAPADRSPTGTFRTGASGAYKVDASGKHKALRSAAKTSPPATRRSAPLGKTSATGKHKALQPRKSLQEQLLDDARAVQLSESSIPKLPKNDSLLSRLVGKLTK
jgi:hypothetical protein